MADTRRREKGWRKGGREGGNATRKLARSTGNPTRKGSNAGICYIAALRTLEAFLVWLAAEMGAKFRGDR